MNHNPPKKIYANINRGTRLKEASWNVSRLPSLNLEQVRVFLELPRAWLERRSWTLPDNCDLKTLWGYIDGHGMGGILGELITSKLLEIDYLREVSQRRYFSNALHHEHSQRVCGDIARAAATLDIPLLLLKGPALVNQAYADSGVRAYGDLDLFVRSRVDAKRLVDGLFARNKAIEDYPSFIKRIQNPGEIQTVFSGWKLEISYPVASDVDPMLDYLISNSDKVFRVPNNLDVLLNPDPNVHFVYLAMHMSINHLCSRLIWFQDLVTLARHQHDNLDWARITRDLETVELLNIASHISGFCRKHIDPSFPVIKSKYKGWNNAFQKNVLEPDSLIKSKFSLRHQGWKPRFLSYCTGASVFYLLGDQPIECLLPSPTATRRSAARFLYGLKIKHRFLLRITELIIVLFMFSFACLLSYSILAKSRHSGQLHNE